MKFKIDSQMKELIVILVLSALGVLIFMFMTQNDFDGSATSETEEMEYQLKQEYSQERWN